MGPFFIQIAKGGSPFILNVHKIDLYEYCRLFMPKMVPELTKKVYLLKPRYVTYITKYALLSFTGKNAKGDKY